MLFLEVFKNTLLGYLLSLISVLALLFKKLERKLLFFIYSNFLHTSLEYLLFSQLHSLIQK